MLAASPGTSITVEATGNEAAEVVEALADSDRLPLRRRRLSASVQSTSRRERIRWLSRMAAGLSRKGACQRSAAHARQATIRYRRSSGRRPRLSPIPSALWSSTAKRLRIEFAVTRLDEVKPERADHGPALSDLPLGVAARRRDRSDQPDAADRRRADSGRRRARPASRRRPKSEQLALRAACVIDRPGLSAARSHRNALQCALSAISQMA